MGGKRDKRKKNPEAKAKKAAKQEQKASKVVFFGAFGEVCFVLGLMGWDERGGGMMGWVCVAGVGCWWV